MCLRVGSGRRSAPSRSRVRRSPIRSLPMQPYPEQHDTGAKRVLSYPNARLTTIPAGQTPARRISPTRSTISPPPERRAVHLAATDPAARDEQPFAGVRRARRAKLQRRRRRSARQSGRGRARDPARPGGTCCEHGAARAASSRSRCSASHSSGAPMACPARTADTSIAAANLYVRAGAVAGALGLQLLQSLLRATRRDRESESGRAGVADRDGVPEYERDELLFATAFCYVPTPVTGCTGGEEHAGDRHIDGELASERSGRARRQDRRSPVCRPDLFRPAR